MPRSTGEPGRRPGRSDGVVALTTWTVDRPALGTRCRLRAYLPEPGQRSEEEPEEDLEDAGPDAVLDLLDDLDRAWGPGGELEGLARVPEGRRTELSWDTVLLLGRTEPPGLALDVPGHAATRTGPVLLPDVETRHALAAELLCCELMDAGALAARVDVGAYRSSANRGIRAVFAD